MSDEGKDVVVVDIRIPFWSMVTLLVKWALASIPAFIILFVIGALLSALFGGVFHWGMMGQGV
ncbi:MAG TPA: hypothetical protein VLX30_06850 [Burkholderiales bacterium]|nr:hypothetical protein [Burkholderiales bacterium]